MHPTNAGSTTAPPRNVTVFAALGPNPAPLTELVWALHRQRDMIVTDIFLVVDDHGHRYLEHELLREGGALRELWRCLGLVDNLESIHKHVVRGPEGAELDDEDPAHADLYNTAVWNLAHEATQHAGTGTLVFGLVAGRRRTMTAMSTMAFQLLARPQDVCLDVRVSDRRAEGASGFYFPEQGDRFIDTGNKGTIDAQKVEVQLMDVRLPRLGSLLDEKHLSTYDSALAAGQRAIEAATPPALVVDLGAGQIRVNDEPLPLTLSQFVWYACLAYARTKDGEGWIDSEHSPVLAELAHDSDQAAWRLGLSALVLRKLLDTPHAIAKLSRADKVALGTNRSKTRAAVDKWCREKWPAYRPLLVPKAVKKKKTASQRILLDPARIKIKHVSSVLKPNK